MGVHKRRTSMRASIMFFVIATALAAATTDFSDETILMDSQTSIDSMKKKGATEADCKDLAKTTCKEVISERRKDQRMMDHLKTGQHCLRLGYHQVIKATAHWKRTKSTHHSMKIRLHRALNVRVSISSQAYKTLRRGKCGFVFGSRSYLRARAEFQAASRAEFLWKARVQEAYKVVLRTKRIRAHMVHKCHCQTKSRFYTVWRLVTNKKRTLRQNRAIAKCKMMTCVLNGINLASKKCKGRLPALRKKRLYSATARVRGCSNSRWGFSASVSTSSSSYTHSSSSHWGFSASGSGNGSHIRKMMSCASKWRCGVSGLSTPVSVDPRNGHVRCMSTNGKDCWWGKCRGNKVPPHGRLRPLVCGAHHAKMHRGHTGYGDGKGHWCNKVRKPVAKICMKSLLTPEGRRGWTVTHMSHHTIHCVTRNGKKVCKRTNHQHITRRV